VLAPKPKPTGVFRSSREPVRAPNPGNTAPQRRQERRAEGRLPGRTVPVVRLPRLESPTHAQSVAVVRIQRRALQGVSPEERQRAYDVGDPETRRQLRYAAAQAQRLQHDADVKRGAEVARRHPGVLSVLTRDAPGVAPPTRVDLTSARVNGTRERPAAVREVLAALGRGAASSYQAPMAHARAPHGAGAALTQLAHLDLSGAGATGIAAAAEAGGDLAGHLNAGVGADSHSILANLGRDAVHLPFDAVNAGIETVKATGDLAKYAPRPLRIAAAPLLGPIGAALEPWDGGKGSTDRARRIVDAQTEGVLGALAAGDVPLALQRFHDHPLYGAMEVTGAYSAVGRTAGALARSGTLGRGVARAGSTARADLRSSRHGGVTEQRSYSKNAITMALQKLGDARLRARGIDPNIASPARAERMVTRATHEDAAALQDIARDDREVARGEVLDALRGPGAKRVAPKGAAGKRERLLRNLVVDASEGRLGAQHHLADNVREEVQRLEHVYEVEHTSMSLAERRLNRKHVKMLRKLEGHLQAGDTALVRDLFERAGLYAKVAGKRTDQLVDLKVLGKEQAEGARHRTFAVTRMGAQHDSTMARTDAAQAAIDTAKGQKRELKVSLQKADAAVETARAELGRVSGRAEVRRGQRRAAVVKPGEALGATRGQRVTAFIDAVERGDPATMKRLAREEGVDAGKVKAARAKVKAAKAERRDAKKALAGVKVPKARKFPIGLVDQNGQKITLEGVRAAFRDEFGDGSIPAFVSHVDRTSEAANFVNWRNQGGRKTADAHKRTGEAARRGTHAFDEQAAVDSVVHAQGVASAAQNWDRFTGRFGTKDQHGNAYTGDGAAAALRERTEGYNAEVPELEWVAVPQAPARYGPERIQEIGEMQGSATGEVPVGLRDEKIPGYTADELEAMGGKGRFVLVPKVALEEFRKAQDPTSWEVSKAAQAFTNVFRGTVLPTSTKWLFGNVAEMALRLAFHHGVQVVGDVRRGRSVMKAIEEADGEVWRQLKMRAQGGQVYGSADRLAIQRNASMFQSRALRGPARAISAARHTVGIQQVVDGYQFYARSVIKLNKMMEQQGQLAVVGKVARRDLQEMTGSWARSLSLQGKVFEELAKGDRLKSTEWAIKVAREIDKTLGKYNRFSPELRKTIQTATPFLPWYLNAARFVYWTLPVESPVRGAVLANVERAFDADMEKRADALPPGDLGANPQRSDGGIVALTRYTPFGAFTGMGRNALEAGDGNGKRFWQTLAEPFFPQFSTPVLTTVFGLNFAHRDLDLESGESPTAGQSGLMALYSLFESVAPFVQIGRRFREGGETGYADSTIFSPKTKKGTAHGRSAATRIFAPWSPTYLAASPTAAKVAGVDAGKATSLEERARQALGGGAVSTGVDPALAARARQALAP
jgi:hypothetical protein